MTIKKQVKQKYLRNRDLMNNIHLSKASYTWYIDGNWKTTKYRDYDIIVCDEEMYEQCKAQMMLQAINRKRLKNNEKRTSVLNDNDIDRYLEREDYDLIEEKLVLFQDEIDDRILRLAKIGHINRKLYEEGKKRITDMPEEEIAKVDDEDVVVRVFSYEHIPDNTDKNTKKTNKFADTKEKVNFPPYKHYALVDGKTTCVAISHFDGEKFSTTHGQINEPLAIGFIKLCNKIAQNYNWRGYTYTDDMVGNALTQLTSMGLQFNEMFSSNPFSYYTSTVNNSFTVIFNEEHAVQQHRDKVLQENNYDPSYTEQLKNDMSRTEYWDKALGVNNMEGGEVRHLSASDITEDDLERLEQAFGDEEVEEEYGETYDEDRL